ncbi:probable DEAD-box ATP-dependent RNA helicase 48, partial [Aristolochia californica]|uniref:probable DEAD-box ATP-dependent RNA helicase 48 n=1 Tax=Aristolochia californica TaxID=171875 RepID=UPI0035DB6187
PRDKLGGGPCTYLGGVSKWQWKRMQAKKAKQLLKARLCRECQIYEKRQRAELRAAVSELERPWEVVERAPTLFSIKADEQLKALANRSQFSGGYDLWLERDETQLFHNQDWLPSARFFPKGFVNNVKPYGIITKVQQRCDNREQRMAQLRQRPLSGLSHHPVVSSLIYLSVITYNGIVTTESNAWLN